MFTKTGKWTDQHGVEHTDAVFQMAHASYSEDRSGGDDFVLDVSSGFANATPQVSTRQANVNNALNYKVYYWANQAAKDSGVAPFTLMNVENNAYHDSFHASALAAEYDGLTAEQKADKHCQEVVLA